MFKNYYRINNPSDRRDIDDSVMEGWINAGNPKAQLWALTPEQPDPSAIWQNGQWVIQPVVPLSYTAEEWLNNQGFQGSRPTACLYFKLQLDAQNKVSPKLNAVQNWMNGILAEGVINPDDKRLDWSTAPYTFQEANTEALQVLNS